MRGTIQADGLTNYLTIINQSHQVGSGRPGAYLYCLYLNVQQLEERLAGSKGLRDLIDEMNHKYTDTEFSFMENFYESPRNWILWFSSHL